jgi:predicted nucleic-acid-binding Zn-ribbon protein
MIMFTKKLACPKCGNTLFELYYVQVNDFYPNGKPLIFIMHKCSNCGWETHPKSVEELKNYIDKVLSGEKIESFVFAKENG